MDLLKNNDFKNMSICAGFIIIGFIIIYVIYCYLNEKTKIVEGYDNNDIHYYNKLSESLQEKNKENNNLVKYKDPYTKIITEISDHTCNKLVEAVINYAVSVDNGNTKKIQLYEGQIQEQRKLIKALGLADACVNPEDIK